MVILKIIIGFILFYLLLFLITLIVTKFVDQFRLYQQDKIRQEKEFKKRNICTIKVQQPSNKVFNKTLGVWEEKDG